MLSSAGAQVWRPAPERNKNQICILFLFCIQNKVDELFILDLLMKNLNENRR